MSVCSSLCRRGTMSSVSILPSLWARCSTIWTGWVTCIPIICTWCSCETAVFKNLGSDSFHLIIHVNFDRVLHPALPAVYHTRLKCVLHDLVPACTFSRTVLDLSLDRVAAPDSLSWVSTGQKLDHAHAVNQKGLHRSSAGIEVVAQHLTSPMIWIYHT